MAETMPNPEQNQDKHGNENGWEDIQNVPFAGEDAGEEPENKTFDADRAGAVNFARMTSEQGEGELSPDKIIIDAEKAWEMAQAEDGYRETASFWGKVANAIGNRDQEALTDLIADDVINTMQKSETGIVRALGNMDLVQGVIRMLATREAKQRLSNLDEKTGRTVTDSYIFEKRSHEETNQEQRVKNAKMNQELAEESADAAGENAGAVYDNVQNMLNN